MGEAGGVTSGPESRALPDGAELFRRGTLTRQMVVLFLLIGLLPLALLTSAGYVDPRTGSGLGDVISSVQTSTLDLKNRLSSYRTTDTFSGELAPWVMKTQGAWVKAGFDSVALALKARAETLYADA